MKRIILAAVLLLLLHPAAFAADDKTKALWEQANTHYIKGDYQGAVQDYEAVVADGYASSRLFYNLGNAYFKDGQLGRSILNYNKALLLSPYDRDAEFNLAVANGYVKDNIAPMPEFPLTRWLHAFRSSLDTNAWAVLSLVFLVAALGFALLFFISERGAWRKAGFFSSLGFVVLFFFAVSSSAAGKRELAAPSQGVILSHAVSVKSAPNSGGSDIFIIHEGTKVDVIASFGDWREIMIADGNKGWVASTDMGLID